MSRRAAASSSCTPSAPNASIKALTGASHPKSTTVPAQSKITRSKCFFKFMLVARIQAVAPYSGSGSYSGNGLYIQKSGDEFFADRKGSGGAGAAGDDGDAHAGLR